MQPHLVDHVGGRRGRSADGGGSCRARSRARCGDARRRRRRGGTGTRPRCPATTVAGKTGTAQKPVPDGGYSTSKLRRVVRRLRPGDAAAAGDPGHGRRAARRDLGRRRRGAGVRADRAVRPAVPGGAARHAGDDAPAATSRPPLRARRAARQVVAPASSAPAACPNVHRRIGRACDRRAAVDSRARWTWSASSRRSPTRTSWGALRWRSATSPTTPARSGPGALFFCVPRRARRRARLRRRGGRARRGRARRRAAARPRRAAARRRRRAPRDGRRAPTSSSATRARSCRSPASPARTARRRPRSCVYAILDGGGPAARAARDGRDARRRRAARRPCGRRPRRSTSSARFREMLDAGDRSCAIEATSHGSAARAGSTACASRPRLHEPDAGPPRLPRDDGGATSRPSGGSSSRRRRRAAVNVGDTWGRRLAAELRAGTRSRTGSRDRTRDARPPSALDGVDLTAARPLQRRERARRARRGAAARASTTRRSRAGSRRCAACRGGSSRSTRASRSR